MNQQQQNNRK